MATSVETAGLTWNSSNKHSLSHLACRSWTGKNVLLSSMMGRPKAVCLYILRPAVQIQCRTQLILFSCHNISMQTLIFLTWCTIHALLIITDNLLSITPYWSDEQKVASILNILETYGQYIKDICGAGLQQLLRINYAHLSPSTHLEMPLW